MSVYFTGFIFLAMAITILIFPLFYNNVLIYIPSIAKYDPSDVLNRMVILVLFGTVWAAYPKLKLSGIRFGALNANRYDRNWLPY